MKPCASKARGMRYLRTCLLVSLMGVLQGLAQTETRSTPQALNQEIEASRRAKSTSQEAVQLWRAAAMARLAHDSAVLDVPGVQELDADILYSHAELRSALRRRDDLLKSRRNLPYKEKTAWEAARTNLELRLDVPGSADEAIVEARSDLNAARQAYAAAVRSLPEIQAVDGEIADLRRQIDSFHAQRRQLIEAAAPGLDALRTAQQSAAQSYRAYVHEDPAQLERLRQRQALLVAEPEAGP